MPEPGAAIRETRFGEWFQNTPIWRDYVLSEAVSELVTLLPTSTRRFDSVLDVGCGSGQAFDLLTDRLEIRRIVGVDLDPSAAEAARARGAPVRLEIHLGDICDLTLPPASMDMVFCHQTLHHVRDQQRALERMWKLLRPGGTLLLAESCRRFVRSLAVRTLFRHPMEVQRSPGEYVSLVRDAGFDVKEDCIRTPEPFWSRPDFGLRRWLGRSTSAYTEASQLHLLASRPSGSG